MQLFNINFSGLNVIDIHDHASVMITREFPEVVNGGLGTFKYAKITLKLKVNAIPSHSRPLPVPLVLKPKIEKELDRLIANGIITPVISSDWSSQIIPVMRSNGTVRICGNYIKLNKELEDVFYPLPRIDDIYASLSGNSKFSKIDLSDAYLQFELSDDSKGLVTISTHKGLFRVNRMPFGVKCSGFYFQKHIEQLFQGIPNVFIFQDDILVGHREEENELEILREVFDKLAKAGLKVNVDKCKFLQGEIKYLGFVLTKQGLAKDKEKLQAINVIPYPTNMKELRSFIGMVNYYSRFVPKMSELLEPLYILLRQGQEFKFDEGCKNAFDRLKSIIMTDQVLTYFDPGLPIYITTDASKTGMSGVLSHIMPDGVERIVACVSRTFTKAELNYSTVHREALACIFAIKKFHDYIFGQNFTIRTDQKALIAILGNNKETNQTYANRLKRYALYLSNFSYKIEHIKGQKNVIADCFSRLTIGNQADNNVDTYDENGLYFTDTSIIDISQIQSETEKDENLKLVMEYLKSSWPNEISSELKPFHNRRLELQTIANCLFWGHKIVVPLKLQKQVMLDLHASHQGIVRSKALARSYFWFVGMDKAIEQMCKSCVACTKIKPCPDKIYVPWPKSHTPFETVHIDYCDLGKTHLLVIVDSYTKWLEIYETPVITSKVTIEKLRDCFARFGLPYTVVSDNATVFTSQVMQQFFTNNKIKHMTIAPYSPQSNGQAENSVKTVKTSLKAALADCSNTGVELSVLIARFLITYRDTPHCVTKKSPAELLFGKRIRTKFDLLIRPKYQTNDANQNNEKMTRNVRSFHRGDVVLVRDYHDINKVQWMEAQIEDKIGSTMYECKTITGVMCRRHVNQIKLLRKANKGGNVAMHDVDDKTIENHSENDKVEIHSSHFDDITGQGYRHRYDQEMTQESRNIVDTPIVGQDNTASETRPRRGIRLPSKYNNYVMGYIRLRGEM
ncbi:uncharacterized protein K02A2.6-like isoform X1 [Photinus pyralis]|nr:uncharacterized protein K02A2.6-like isoform X1 [Photinus pyralis]XP_031350304.1 uncharacterized protein K02A2.6-like isoform X1 [Photinus pyralis]XP_031353693.1 uncharacterized protein K02A2.6-like isoform X1 [Photinus pyralis]XP_031353695.1 uncharacterized protein K02A2.6-like isoform X1 [Photinus pyralis]